MSLRWRMGCPGGGKPGPGYPARLRPGRDQPGRQGGRCEICLSFGKYQIGEEPRVCLVRPGPPADLDLLPFPQHPGSPLLTQSPRTRCPSASPPARTPSSPRVSESPWCRAWEAPALPVSPLPHPTGLFLMTVGGVPGVSPLLLAPGARVWVLSHVHAQLYSHLSLTPSPCLLIFLGHHNPVFLPFSSSIFLSWVSGGGGASAMTLFSPFPAQTPPPPGPSGRG